MKTLFAAASVAALLAAAPALAQENTAPDRTQGDVLFTGFRAEGRLGYSNQNIRPFTSAESDLLDVRRRYNGDGVQIGVGAGFDFGVGGLVIGPEAGIDWTLGSSRLRVPGETAGARINYGRDIGLGGRVGVRSGENVLLYAKGGYTNLQVDTRGSTVLGSVPNVRDVPLEVQFGRRGNLDGWRVGGGIEYALPVNLMGSAVYAKAEYRHSRYDGNVQKNEAMFGLGFRF